MRESFLVAGHRTVKSFDAALKKAQAETEEQHVLLGNGFSIACRGDCFRYGELYRAASFDGASADIHRIFEILGTTDFERVIEALQIAADLADTYAGDTSLIARLKGDAQIVRESLAHVLAERHPDVVFDISPGEYRSARQFLSHFDRIYTVNYDMLLYWAVVQDELDPPGVQRNDGFRNSEDPDDDYVVWYPYDTFRNQRVFYLHGGLHLYDRGYQLEKITWKRTQIPLLDQIRDALTSRRYPLIVTEGTSQDKLARILHSAYLTHGIRTLDQRRGSLFVHGHSLAENDRHIFQRVVAARQLSHLFVSLHGDPASNANQQIIQRASALASERADNRPLAVNFYDSESAAVWGTRRSRASS